MTTMALIFFELAILRLASLPDATLHSPQTLVAVESTVASMQHGPIVSGVESAAHRIPRSLPTVVEGKTLS